MAIEYGDELIQLIEIDQPVCSRTFGTAPCAAALGTTGTKKCFNTRVTCQDAGNFLSTTLTLRFSRPQEGIAQYGYLIPSLDSVSITPLKINLGSMDRSLSAFGQREVATLTFCDHQHSDLIVDKYRLGRHDGTADLSGSYDPYERGSFWGKWLARNPYYEGCALRIYDGKVGQPIGEMQVRHYVIDKISGPSGGKVTVTAKDLFSKVEDRKAKAPTASRGELAAGISAGATSATLSPAGIGNLDYPASGRIAIGEEAIAFTRSGDTLTLSTRGDLNTAAASHDAGDKVQLILSFVAQRSDMIVNSLLTNYAGIDSFQIPLTDWDTEAAANLTNLYTSHIAEPTPVGQLVGELEEQAGFTVWPDVCENKIRLKAIVPAVGVISPTVNDNLWIKDGSLTITRVPDLRTSQVWVYFGQVNPLKKLDEKTNYRSRAIVADLESENDDQYKTPSVKEIYSRWIPQFGRSSAVDVGERILSMFRDTPFRSAFSLHAAREGALTLATPFLLDTDEVQDESGSNKVTAHVPIKLVRQEDTISVESQLLRFFTLPSEAPGGGSIRNIYIDNDTLDFNLRTAHDQLYSSPSSGDLVRLYIAEGVVVGSSSTSTPAFATGNWPTGVEVQIFNRGRIAGRGGAGGEAGISIGI